MKHFPKVFILIITLATVFQMISVNAVGSYITLNGYTFDFNAQGEAVIYSYDNRSTAPVIPSKLMGADVTVIDDYAFFNADKLESVDFSKAVNLKTIGKGAFHGCTRLSAIDISESVVQLGFGTFQNCTGLTTVDLRGELTVIPEQCFFGCEKLNGVILPQSAVTIGKYAFGNCSALTDITIPASVTNIAENAFSGCDDLVIYGYRDSYAITYAEQMGIDYYIIDNYSAGDANLDGSIDIRDVTFIQKYNIGKVEINSNLQREIADVNHDGKVSVRDATLIQMYIAGIITEF